MKTKIVAYILLFISLSAQTDLPKAYMSEVIEVDTAALTRSEAASPQLTYGKLGIAWIIPSVGIGMRSHQGFHGMDCSVQGGRLEEGAYYLSAKALYLNYPTQKNFYFGVGGGVWKTELIIFSGVYPSLEQEIGYEWSNAFIQLEIAEIFGVIPVPTLSMGFGF